MINFHAANATVSLFSNKVVGVDYYVTATSIYYIYNAYAFVLLADRTSQRIFGS
jgi:hypothetical protein